VRSVVLVPRLDPLGVTGRTHPFNPQRLAGGAEPLPARALLVALTTVALHGLAAATLPRVGGGLELVIRHAALLESGGLGMFP